MGAPPVRFRTDHPFDRAIMTPTSRRTLLLRRLAHTTGMLMLVVTLGALAACSRPPKLEPDRPVENLYNTGMNLLVTSDYPGAVRFFKEVERQHPYSVWANKAIIMSAYANYLDHRYDDAVISLNRFIRLHPGSSDVAYAYYLRALCYYEQIADIKRDQAATRKAMDALKDVVRRFPNSEYANDASLKIDLTRDQIAGHDMAIGRWYEDHKEYQAAINRFREVVDKYQTTSHVPEALHRLTECYLALGLTDEARKTASVLGHNFPGSEWYSDSYALLTGKGPRQQEAEESQSWLGRAWHSVF